jgi:N-acetyl-gamma-glutamyl-phosphate reductase
MNTPTNRIPVVVVGGNGYVSGELLRLLGMHPGFQVAAVTSTSHAGDKITNQFPHLNGVFSHDLVFEPLTQLPALFEKYRKQPIGVLLATPHGATAGLAVELLEMAKQVGASLRLVDLSADFRFEDTERYAKIYKAAHGAPILQKNFFCGIPELSPGTMNAQHVAHPGCFTTASVLAAYPFFNFNLVEDTVFVSAVTGSSGSGRKPIAGTHHPERHSNLYAYTPLAHRHEEEMKILIGRACGGKEPEVDFVPHSGAHSRGIHATVQMRLKQPASATLAEELVTKVNELYAHTPFVRASLTPPKLNEVAGTNRCQLGIAVRGRTLVVTSAIDNMMKGSAGGGMQWLNRLCCFPEHTGLVLPGLGWY